MNYFLILLCTFQGQSACEYWLKRGLSALERYFFLILFNAYLHEQVRAKGNKNNFTKTKSNKACVAGTRKVWVCERTGHAAKGSTYFAGQIRYW